MQVFASAVPGLEEAIYTAARESVDRTAVGLPPAPGHAAGPGAALAHPGVPARVTLAGHPWEDGARDRRVPGGGHQAGVRVRSGLAGLVPVRPRGGTGARGAGDRGLT